MSHDLPSLPDSREDSRVPSVHGRQGGQPLVEGKERSGAGAREGEARETCRERVIKVGDRAPSATRGRSQRPQAIDPRLIPFRDAMADLLVDWVLKQPRFAHLRQDRKVG